MPPDYLDRLHRRGLIDRVARGLYAWPDAEVTEHHSLAEAAKQVPKGVVCLLSALRFHGLTTQAPREIWLALPRNIGTDVALEALRDCRRKRLCTMDALWDAAQVCRVTRVIRPYLESLV